MAFCILNCSLHTGQPDGAYAPAASCNDEQAHDKSFLRDDSDMNSMFRAQASERAAQAQHATEQRAQAQQYATSLRAKNELALATLSASKETGLLLLDCLAHAASQRMKGLNSSGAGLNTAQQQQQLACMGIWSAAAAAVRIPSLNFSRLL
jgi:hypothetical protein